MTPSFLPRRAAGPLAVLAQHKATLIGWVAGWSAFTYSGAALRWHQTDGGGDLRTAANAIFHIADLIPPYAKIAFGALFLLALFALPRLADGRVVRGTAASLLSALAVLMIAPLDYFDGTLGSFAAHAGLGTAALHLLPAALAGLCWAGVSAHYARKGQGK
ncbi:hypothetical protein S2M10_25990 [Sphingomonas sp. S2M10]|uniref:hypothetical protein n=1 Tax=Sphingomonas sp. S2M10 TaxID=2705010 RepID=UPI0014565A92|nr:hypothetical protein [Sphingomonas sp. S2M10]NLS27600.1 hypothetical protein [Sphingomonas sp. S2M10]